MPHKYLIREFEDFVRTSSDAESLMEYVSHRIHTHIPRYNWVGFYLTDPKNPTTLMLGPHTGSFTPNQRISLNEGLCGTAAAIGGVVVADNVAEDPRYLQVSDMVKSQISMPLKAGGRTAGVFHIESYFLSTFGPALEREFVATCAGIVERCLERTRAQVPVMHALSLAHGPAKL